MRISLGEIERVAGWALPPVGKTYVGICLNGRKAEVGQVLIHGRALRMLVDAVRALRDLQADAAPGRKRAIAAALRNITP